MRTARTLFFTLRRHAGGTSDCWRGESRQLAEGDFGRFLSQTGHGLKNVPASLLLFCIKNPYFVRAAKIADLRKKRWTVWQSVHVAGQGISHTARARHASHGPDERNEIGNAKHRVCEDGKSIAFSHDAVPLREKEFPLPASRSAVADVLKCLSQVTMSSGGFAFACAAIRRWSRRSFRRNPGAFAGQPVFLPFPRRCRCKFKQGIWNVFWVHFVKRRQHPAAFSHAQGG